MTNTEKKFITNVDNNIIRVCRMNIILLISMSDIQVKYGARWMININISHPLEVKKVRIKPRSTLASSLYAEIIAKVLSGLAVGEIFLRCKLWVPRQTNHLKQHVALMVFQAEY